VISAQCRSTGVQSERVRGRRRVRWPRLHPPARIVGECSAGHAKGASPDQAASLGSAAYDMYAPTCLGNA
jgi:hypothetical protein